MNQQPPSFSEVTILFPLNSRMPTMVGKWRRTRQGIEARYTPEELETALLIAGVWADEARQVAGVYARP